MTSLERNMWPLCKKIGGHFLNNPQLNGNNVPTATVMGEYFFKNNKKDIYKTEQVWAIDWFNYVKDDDINRQFFEHCIPYKNKALSLIWEK